MAKRVQSQTVAGTASETSVARLVPGMRVEITAGELKGVTGDFVERRRVGKALVCLGRSVYVEIHEFWLLAVERK